MGDRPPLVPFNEATRRILDGVRPLPPETIPLHAAAGRVLAVRFTSTEDVPARPISAMDGYAVPSDVLARILNDGATMANVVGEVAAGRPGLPEPPAPDAVVRIFTGGVVPPWAAAVVVQEQARRDGDRVTLYGPVADGAFIRAAGSDIRAGETALEAGDVLHPPALALLASLGFAAVPVGTRPRVGVAVTGSEIVPDGAPAPGQVRDANGPALEAAARACGAGRVDRVTLPDDPGTLRAGLGALLDRVDVLLTTGGVSVGDHDHVGEVLASLGVARAFWGVAQRPGRPMFAGTRDGVAVLGLPGNPASALATFLCHGWPLLRRLQGAAPERMVSRAVLAEPVSKPRSLAAMLRGRRHRDGATVRVATAGPQDSHQMLPFARSDCLILCPAGVETLAAGTEVDVLPYPWSPAP